MTFDQWREANYDTSWNERDYARAAWDAAIAAEREACARIAEQTFEGGCPNTDGDSGFDFMGENSAAAIRERSAK